MASVKVHIKFGDAEIEVEGEKADLDPLITEWWKQVQTGEPERRQDDDESRQAVGDTPPARKASKPATRKPRRAPAEKKEGGDLFDELALSNTIKEQPHYDRFEAKILHGSNMWHKISFVLHFAGEAMTSGQVARVLQSLGIKADPGYVSNSLKANGSKLLNSAVRKPGVTPKYKLTSKADGEAKTLLADAQK